MQTTVSAAQAIAAIDRRRSPDVRDFNKKQLFRRARLRRIPKTEWVSDSKIQNNLLRVSRPRVPEEERYAQGMPGDGLHATNRCKAQSRPQAREHLCHHQQRARKADQQRL